MPRWQTGESVIMSLFAMLTPSAAIMGLAMIVVIALVLTRLLTRGLPALFAKHPDHRRESSEPANDDAQPHESQ
jgi:hypothetical protein